MQVTLGDDRLYLQTSPELFMKRLLCAESGDIYTITKSFRGAEYGRIHNPEFSLLEWYRVGFGIDELIADVERLFEYLGITESSRRYLYADIFISAVGVNPHFAEKAELQDIAKRHGLVGELGVPELLDFLMTTLVEPELGEGLAFIYGFPSCQAEMAELASNQEGETIAKRFELYWRGVELANGYKELCDSKEQRTRFQLAAAERIRKGLPQPNIDEKFLAALEAGMPDCSGVALGLDRLLMCMQGEPELSEFLYFRWDDL